ncbi:MAG: type II toxin-antitoxin system HicA family toxin [Microcoleus sp.]
MSSVFSAVKSFRCSRKRYESAKGSHTKWSHPLLQGKLTLSGKDGGDAKLYQEKDVDNALKQLAEIEEKNR